MKNCNIIIMNEDAELEEEGAGRLVSASSDYFGIFFFSVFITWNTRVVLEWGATDLGSYEEEKIISGSASRFHKDV